MLYKLLQGNLDNHLLPRMLFEPYRKPTRGRGGGESSIEQPEVQGGGGSLDKTARSVEGEEGEASIGRSEVWERGER